MSKRARIALVVTTALLLAGAATAGRDRSCRTGYGYRENADFVLKRLRLKPGQVVVDIGAGDGWWARQIAGKLGEEGLVYAGEVDQKKVDRMKQDLADVPQVKPYLCPKDGTGLGENSCDLAFISKTYHHFDKGSHVDYLRHLTKVVKPAGSVCIVERHSALAEGGAKEHAWAPGLMIQQAEQAGWIMLRCEFIPGSDHFMAVFVHPDFLVKRIFGRKGPAGKNRPSGQ